jgi:hypothetical protein
MTVALAPDNRATQPPKGSVKDHPDPEVQALLEAVATLTFEVPVIAVPGDDLGRCEFCPPESETGSQPLDAVGAIVTRPELSGRVYRESTCAGCATTVLIRDHRRGLRDGLWVETPTT